MLYTDHVNQHKQCLFSRYARWHAFITQTTAIICLHDFQLPWLLESSYRAFSLPKQWNGGHVDTQHAGKLQLPVPSKSCTHFLRDVCKVFKWTLNLNNLSAAVTISCLETQKSAILHNTWQAWRRCHLPLMTFFTKKTHSMATFWMQSHAIRTYQDFSSQADRTRENSIWRHPY